jgi:hypothetical protein
MSEPGYQVVWPLGKLAYHEVALKPRVMDLNGKTNSLLRMGRLRRIFMVRFPCSCTWKWNFLP